MEALADCETKTHLVTLHLPDDLYATAEEAVALGLAPSQSDFIQDAIRRRAREVRHARMDKLAEEAMNDPDFVADMRETMEAFHHVDKEHWPPSLEAEEEEDSRPASLAP